MTAVFFAAAAVFAVGDWYAVARENKQLEYVCKPATLVALIGAAVSIYPAEDARRFAFVVALLFSLAGDVFLMLPRDLFLPGLVSFFVAHMAYIAGFVVQPHHSGVAWIVGVLPVALIATPILRAVRSKQPDLFVPVAVYIFVITVMFGAAIASAIPVAVVGAALFVTSDAHIAWNRFVRPLRWAPVTIIVTYHVAQALLVASLRF